jgi:hypothetical protein
MSQRDVAPTGAPLLDVTLEGVPGRALVGLLRIDAAAARAAPAPGSGRD